MLSVPLRIDSESDIAYVINFPVFQHYLHETRTVPYNLSHATEVIPTPVDGVANAGPLCSEGWCKAVTMTIRCTTQCCAKYCCLSVCRGDDGGVL